MQNEAEMGLSAPKKALENFWYHYKWHTVIIAFFAVFFIIAAAQMSSKESYDAHILYTGPKYIDGETAADIKNGIIKISELYGNGEDNPAECTKDDILTLDFNTIVYVPDELALQYKEDDIYFDAVGNINARTRFDNLIVVGEYVVMLIDKSLYDSTVTQNVFLTWEESLGYVPDGAYDDYGIMLSDLPIGAENGFRQLPDDTVLCCRAKSYVGTLKKNAKREAQYSAQCELFRQIVTYVPEQ